MTDSDSEQPPGTIPRRRRAFTSNEIRQDENGRRYVHRTVVFEDAAGNPLDTNTIETPIDESLQTTQWAETTITSDEADASDIADREEKP